MYGGRKEIVCLCRLKNPRESAVNVKALALKERPKVVMTAVERSPLLRKCLALSRIFAFQIATGEFVARLHREHAMRKQVSLILVSAFLEA